MRYRSIDELGRKLMMMTADLKPAGYLPLHQAKALVARVLKAVFLPLESLDGGANEHAFWSVVAVVHAVRRQENASREALRGKQLAAGEAEKVAPLTEFEDAELVRLYRHFHTQHEDRLNAEEAAVLQSLGVPGVLLFNPDDRGKA